ncbi:MAG: secretin N-terminal domain-containing protein, partial [Planctomycetota bacterium]
MSVSLVAAPGANALVMTGLEADLAEVEKLIEPLDARPANDAIDARTFTLEHAEAATVGPVVQRLLTDQAASDPRVMIERIRRSRGQVELTPEIRVEIDERTNALIVSGPQRTVNLAETLIGQLDRPDTGPSRSYVVFTPSTGDPARLAETALSLLRSTQATGRRIGVELIAEPQSGAILVIGRPDEQTEAMKLLTRLDEQTLTAPPMDLRIVALERADAATIAQTLTPLLRDQSRWPPALRAAARAGVPVAQPSVTADPEANRLLVSAPAILMPMASELIIRLDRSRAVGAVEVRIFNLRQAEATQAADAVRDALAARRRAQPGLPEPAVTAESSSNSLIVTASPEQLVEAQRIVESLDEGLGSDQSQVRTVFLEHARAETVAPIVQQLLAGEELPSWMRFEVLRRRNAPDLGPEVRVAADKRLNAVVVSGPLSVLNVAEQMIAQMDVDPRTLAGASTRTVRVLVVDNADAGQLAQNLQAIFDEQDVSETPPTIRVDTASNSLIVRATAAQFQTMEQVVASIDKASITASRQMQMIPIDPSRASADEVARTLQRLLDQGGAPRVEVIELEDLLKRNRGEDEPLDGSSSRIEVDPATPRVSSAPVSRWLALAGFAAGLPRGQAEAEPETQEPGVTIAVDPVTNSIIVIGSPRAIERVAALAEQVQMQIPAAPGTVRAIGLPEQLIAQDMAQLVNRTLERLTPAGGRPGGYRQRVTVLPDPAANALVVVANDTDFQMVGELIGALSRAPSTEEVVVKIYPLETITVERALSSVQGLLEPDQAAGGRRRTRQAQRMRNLAVTLLDGDERIEAVFSPDRVRVSSDPQTNSLVVMGPSDAMSFMDQFIELIDQTPVNVQTTLKLYALEHAQAGDLEDTLRRLFRSRFRSMQRRPGVSAVEPEFESDDRTNTLLVTASPEALAEVDALLEQLDRPLGDDLHALRIVELDAARPNEVAELLDRVVLGADQNRRTGTLIVPDDNSGLLLVRASDEVYAEIQAVLAEIDRDATSQFDVRTITLERADAAAVADALQRFFDDRARIASSGRGRREQARRVSIIGDPTSRTLLIAASDEDYAQIEQLVAQFDTPQAAGALSFRVFPLQHAKARDLQDTVQQLVNDLVWNQPFFFVWPPQNQGGDDKVAIRADERLNALIVTGDGDKFDLVEGLIDVLDAPLPADEARVVRLYRLEHADLDLVANLVEEVFAEGMPRRWWEPPDPNEIKVRRDERSNTLIVAGTAGQQDDVAELIESIDTQVALADQQIEILAIEYGRADELAETLRRFLIDRARAMNEPEPSATIVASDSANSLVVSATAEDMVTLRDLLGRLDRPDVTGERVTEIIALQEGQADEIARIVEDQFGRRRGQSPVSITSDLRTNSVIVSAPRAEFAQVQALIAELDAPSASDETIIRTYALEGAQAEEVVRILTDTLQLDERGETDGITIRLDDSDAPAVEVRAKVVADRRSNSLVVTATEESFPVIEALISKVDAVPAAIEREWRIIPLQHAKAPDVYFTLSELLRRARGRDEPEARIDYNKAENQLIVAATPDQYEQIEQIISQLDVPSTRQRTTEFIPLRFAEAEKVSEALSFFYGSFAPGAETPSAENVVIVADPATNSLVISADRSEWESIRALLSELDSEEYDTTLQLRVIPLRYADAASVARAINDAFQGTIERDQRLGRGDRGRERSDRGDRGEDGRREADVPSVLVESEEWVRASAEPQTNSVIISASRQNIRKIEQIIEQLDVADYAQLPPPQLIPVAAGDPVAMAAALQQLYEQSGGDRRDGRGGRSLRIVGDQSSNTIIVRAEEEEFRQIQTLAQALQQQSSEQGLGIHVVHLTSAPARRVAEAIAGAFEAKATQANQPLSIEVDVPGNSLVIASTAALVEEIRRTVEQLDQLAPAAGQSIFIIELEHISPEAAQRVIETIGLDKEQRDDSVSRLVSEPITVSTLDGRNALVIVANPVDRETVVGLLKAVDAAPSMAEAQMRVVPLKRASAEALAQILTEVLDPVAQQSSTQLARAIQEQVRRLAVRRDGLDEPDLQLDLTKPIRVIADRGVNALIVSSTPENIRALEELIAMFDTLPVTDAVTVQLFPLENIAADQFARIVEDLFAQGKQLGQVPGSEVAGVPGGTVGKALLDEVAISIDERTNTVVVAGKEEAVALVEVLSQRLDSEIAAGWVEPRLVPLRFADAETLADLLRAVLVEGQEDLPQASPLQRQVARLRMARADENGGKVLESDVFQPMNRLVIRAEPQLNSIVLVGTPMNLEVVGELIAMFDVEAASPSAVVRIYPVEHASAARLAETITNLFDQQVESKAIRPEDRVIVQADDRTNSMIVTTSQRSFTVLERLLEMLDQEIAPDLREIRVIELRHASAVRMADLIQQMMDARLERLQKVQPETADLEKATVIAEPRTNRLIVAAGNESFEVIQGLAESLDSTMLGEQALIEVITVETNNIDRLAQTIDQIM